MMMDTFFYGEFLQDDFLRSIIRNYCDQNINREFCANMLFLIFGFDREQLDYTLLPLILSHYPAGTSAKTLVHFVQEIESGKFREYDYGREENLLMYNSVEPPEYDIANIRIPMALFYSKNDWMVDPVCLLNHLSNAMRFMGIMYLVSFCGHLDVVPTDVTFKLTISAHLKRISWIGWNWLNNKEFNFTIVHTPEMIRRAGYPVEVYVIMTEDGYYLTLHRIPGGKGSLPVLFQPGYLCSSGIWVALGKGKALPYLLADRGYDVWLGNFRGNIYSRRHISLSPSESKFWDYNFNELAVYDLPAIITFISNMTSQPIHSYVGISMGTTIFYVMATERPDIAKMVQMMISFGPAAFLDHMTSPIRYLTFLCKMDWIMRFVFHKFLLIDFVRVSLKYLCSHNLGKEICAHTIFMMWGYDWEQLDYILLPDIISHFPAGGSAYILMQYAQAIESGKFRQYDYGHAKNLLIYNSMEPPDYNLSKITVPIALFYGPGDTLVDIVDLKRLFCALSNVMDVYAVPWSNFNHVDFIWAKDAPKLVYERIFRIMKKEKMNDTLAIKMKNECNTLNI
ncbi:gastric triacylglycerol lipase-like isoform X1 [Nylanderia fulva]|uniref:gastric triacylglycerol lipase-like isoform X1 n=1 Tax=Nylanderia fulva TaxID=613905 RepID=UPI0010FB0F8F|nr:gastric triacylglycerol lipase-like isoform X1 [Nylanderia fulva]